jgi:hypothetical protein
MFKFLVVFLKDFVKNNLPISINDNSLPKKPSLRRRKQSAPFLAVRFHCWAKPKDCFLRRNDALFGSYRSNKIEWVSF